MIDLCIDQLFERFEIQARKCVRNYPFLMGQGVWLDSEGLDWNDEVREVLKHGTLSIGFIGLAETLKALVARTTARAKWPATWALRSSPTCAAAATRPAGRPA